MEAEDKNLNLEGSSTDSVKQDMVCDLSSFLQEFFFFFFKLLLCAFLFVLPAFGGCVILYCNLVLSLYEDLIIHMTREFTCWKLANVEC